MNILKSSPGHVVGAQFRGDGDFVCVCVCVCVCVLVCVVEEVGWGTIVRKGFKEMEALSCFLKESGF